MLKENRPVVSAISSLSEANSSKPNFVWVGTPTEAVNGVAGAWKAHVSFWNISELTGQAEGSLHLVQDGTITQSLAAGGDISAFVNGNAYPLVGELTPEN